MINLGQWDLFGLNIIIDIFFTFFVIVVALPVLLISYIGNKFSKLIKIMNFVYRSLN